MLDSQIVWKNGNKKEIWDRFCGFIDLSLDEFMGIQQQLLMEHISIISGSELGKTLLKGKTPKTVEEFRNTVPLTDYSFYEPFLANKREDALAMKPRDWVCTSGTSGIRKWVPLMQGLYDAIMPLTLGMMILGTAKGKYDFSLRPGDKFFASVPPPPYFSGYMVKNLSEIWDFPLLPPMDKDYELSDLPARSARGFKMAMEQGLDIIFALPSVMVRIGEQFGQTTGKPILPKNVWNPKLCFVAGMDLAAFRDRIVQYWGVDPYEFYAQTESLGMPGLQLWNHKAMTPQPFTSFYEFIPEDESIKSLNDAHYQPKTCLFNELKVGNSYELVFTNFYGGAFARYRPKDMITVVASRDEETGVKLPQLLLKGRADRLIDLGGFTRIDERTIWLALEDAKVKYEEWMAVKEPGAEHPVLHIYISTDTKEDPVNVATRLDTALKKYDSSYADLEKMLKWNPLRLTYLPLGVFSRWQMEQVKNGADPAFVKEQRMQPSAANVRRILDLARG